MPDPNAVPPETIWDVLFALVGGVSGLVATNLASRMFRDMNKPPTAKLWFVGLLFGLSFALILAVVYRVLAGFENPIPALPMAFVASSLLTVLMLFPLWGIHSFLRKYAQKNRDAEM